MCAEPFFYSASMMYHKSNPKFSWMTLLATILNSGSCWLLERAEQAPSNFIWNLSAPLWKCIPKLNCKHLRGWMVSTQMYTKKVAGRTFRAQGSFPFVFDNNLNPNYYSLFLRYKCDFFWVQAFKLCSFSTVFSAKQPSYFVWILNETLKISLGFFRRWWNFSMLHIL